jgi:hypothetical protein
VPFEKNDAANIQKSNSVNHPNPCATIRKARILEGTPATRNPDKKKRHWSKRWHTSKNDLYKFDSQFSIEFKNKIKVRRLPSKKHSFSVFIILRHTAYIPQHPPNVQQKHSYHPEKPKSWFLQQQTSHGALPRLWDTL